MKKLVVLLILVGLVSVLVFGGISSVKGAVNLESYVGIMYQLGSDYVGQSNEANIRYVLGRAQQLYVKLIHLEVFPRPGEFYTTRSSWSTKGGSSMTQTWVKQLVQLCKSYGFKTIFYMNTWCDSSLSGSYSDAVTGYGGFGGPVMNFDMGKSYGPVILQQMIKIMDDWGFDGFEMDGIALDGEDYISVIGSHTESFFQQVHSACNSRGKLFMGNPNRNDKGNWYHSSMQPYVDTICNAMDSGEYDLNKVNSRLGGPYAGPWYSWYRDDLGYTDDQIQYHYWEPPPQGYGNEPLTRSEWQTFLQWCLTGKCLIGARWNEFMINNMWDNKDLFDTYMPQVITEIKVMLGTQPTEGYIRVEAYENSISITATATVSGSEHATPWTFTVTPGIAHNVMCTYSTYSSQQQQVSVDVGQTKTVKFYFGSEPQSDGNWWKYFVDNPEVSMGIVIFVLLLAVVFLVKRRKKLSSRR